MPIWFVKRDHLPPTNKRITETMRRQLVECVGLSAIVAAYDGQPYMVSPTVLEALRMGAEQALALQGPPP